MLDVGTKHILHLFAYEFSALQLERCSSGTHVIRQQSPCTCLQAGGQEALPVKMMGQRCLLATIEDTGTGHGSGESGRGKATSLPTSTLGKCQCPEVWPKDATF